MKNRWLLSLAPLLLLAMSSSLTLTAAVSLRLRFPAAGQSAVGCRTDKVYAGAGVYAANSTYEANLHRVAALLTAEVAAKPGQPFTTRAVGYWPNRLMASSFCRHRYVNGSGDAVGYPCADCIAGAFLEVERACPYRREAIFSNQNCSLQLAEIGIFEAKIMKQAMASGLIFQAIGFGCLFFLLFQEWRSRKRGTLMHSAPLLSGD